MIRPTVGEPRPAAGLDTALVLLADQPSNESPSLTDKRGPNRRLVRLADQPANESPPNRRLVRLADQPANEGSNQGPEWGPNRRLVRLADQPANESPNLTGEGPPDRRLVRLADQGPNRGGAEPARHPSGLLCGMRPGCFVAFGAVRGGRGTIVRVGADMPLS